MGVNKSKTSVKSSKERQRVGDEDENFNPSTIEDVWPSNSITQVTPAATGPPTVLIADLKPKKADS